MHKEMRLPLTIDNAKISIYTGQLPRKRKLDIELIAEHLVELMEGDPKQINEFIEHVEIMRDAYNQK